jgi:hypothetical protein
LVVYCIGHAQKKTKLNIMINYSSDEEDEEEAGAGPSRAARRVVSCFVSETNAVENKIRFKTATTKGNQENGEKDGTN